MQHNLTRLSAAALGSAAALTLCTGAAAADATNGASDRNLQAMNSRNTEKPEAVSRLEAAYGTPSQAGFGSAVFHQTLRGEDDLAQAALSTYRAFVGRLWERYGEQAWMGPWKEVYARKPGVAPDIVTELRSITDPDAQLSVPMILDNIEGAETARGTLSAAFDDPAITELRAFNLGDGEAMSGILIAGRREVSGNATFLVFLMD